MKIRASASSFFRFEVDSSIHKILKEKTAQSTFRKALGEIYGSHASLWSKVYKSVLNVNETI